MSFLVDTNVFLEILLEQNKKEICKTFLESNIDRLFISDFSLHSLGVILFKYNKSEVFKIFIDDTLDRLEILTLSKEKYSHILKINNQYKLDFDDSYQFLLAQENNLTLVTMDNDYKTVGNVADISFL
jgi:predicted nucleic acid-binding protein